MNCKICDIPIDFSQTSSFSGSIAFLTRTQAICSKCKQYSLVLLRDGIIESETIRSGNFYLTYLPQFKTASISSTDENDKKILKNLDMNELTHEQAVQWVNKLKMYVVFS